MGAWGRVALPGHLLKSFRRRLFGVFLFALTLFPSLRLVETRTMKFPYQLPTSVGPGEMLSFEKRAGIELRWNEWPLSSHPNGTDWFGVSPLSGQSEIAAFQWHDPRTFFSHPQLHVARHRLTVINRPIQRVPKLRLPASVQDRLKASSEERRLRDRETLRAVLTRTQTPFTQSCWSPPLATKVTSHYASPRVPPSGQVYYHTGEDLRAPLGTPVSAVASGRVVLVDNFVVAGLNVVIDHGEGVFSRYAHLSKTDRRPGDFVSQGAIIGLSGDTGRVEAPHLHWEIYWNSRPANPRSFLVGLGRNCNF